MITILDPDCIVYERIWCIFEFYKAHEMKKTKKEFLFDIYTDTFDDKVNDAVGITDGLIDNDYGNTNLKSKRELIFPINRITLIAVKVDITKAKASNKNDEKKIREIIAESNVTSEDLNNLLHGIFVSSVLERLLKESTPVDANRYLNIIKQSHVTNINLNFIDCDKTEDTIFQQITDSLPKTLTRFKFYSGGSKISEKSLTKIFTTPLNLPNLAEIKMAYNKMNDDGVEMLVSAFILSNNSKLESLDIGVNEITCVGIEKISRLFPQLQKSLKVLILSKNKISDHGAIYIANCLNSHLEILEILRLSNNHIGDKGAIALAKAISDHERLEVVKMNSNDIHDDGAFEIATCLSKNKSLKKFYLQDNEFSLDAIITIANAVKSNTRLKLLSVNNAIGKELNKIEFEWKKVNTDIEFFY